MEHHEFLREIRGNDRMYHTLKDDLDQSLYGRKFKEKKLTGSDFNKIKGYNLSEKYDISMLEKQLVYAYLKNTGIDYSKNSLLKKYLVSVSILPDKKLRNSPFKAIFRIRFKGSDRLSESVKMSVKVRKDSAQMIISVSEDTFRPVTGSFFI